MCLYMPIYGICGFGFGLGGRTGSSRLVEKCSSAERQSICAAEAVVIIRRSRWGGDGGGGGREALFFGWVLGATGTNLQSEAKHIRERGAKMPMRGQDF